MIDRIIKAVSIQDYTHVLKYKKYDYDWLCIFAARNDTKFEEIYPQTESK